MEPSDPALPPRRPGGAAPAEATQTLVKNLEGKLFLMHGMMDDNVPLWNMDVVMDALIKAHEDFDLLLLPHLFGAEPAKDYQIKSLPPSGTSGGD